MADLESQSGHDSMRKSEGGGSIVPKDQDLVDTSENSVAVDESQEYKGQHVCVCVCVNRSPGANSVTEL